MILLMEKSDSPWLAGRVPNGYWDVRDNRVCYMDWLAHRCGFKEADDWYKASRSLFQNNRGGGLMCTQYGDSVSAALQDYRPDYDWVPWKFRRTPSNFWTQPENRRRYMDWLSAELGFQKPEDWYAVTKQTFVEHHGGGLFRLYAESVLAAVQEYYPDFNWHPWLFNESPNRFWHDVKNRQSYMKWLGQQLGYKRPEDWYAISKNQFRENNGAAFLHVYGDSPQKAVREYLPGLTWTPWLFRSVPARFWCDVDNRMSYLQWLGQKLGFQDSSDWYRLVSSDFQDNRGGGLLDFYSSGLTGKAIAEAMRESGTRRVDVWPVIQLIECSTNRDPQALFRALTT